MADSRFFVVLFVLAAFGISNGASNHEKCVESAETASPNKFCINKTPKYNSYVEDMKAVLKKNKDLTNLKPRPLKYIPSPDDYNDSNDCMTRTTIEQPYMIKDNTTLHYVVQLENFKQMIQVTRCESINKSCFENIYTKNNEIEVEATCREKTGYVSLYVYDSSAKKFKHKSFELPVCCACMLKKY